MKVNYGSFKVSDNNDSLENFYRLVCKRYVLSNLLVAALGISLVYSNYNHNSNELNLPLLFSTLLACTFLFYLSLKKMRELPLIFEKCWVDIDSDGFTFYDLDNGKKSIKTTISSKENWKIVKLPHIPAYQLESSRHPSFPMLGKMHIIAISNRRETSDRLILRIFPDAIK